MVFCAVPSQLQEGGEHAEPAERQAGGGGTAAALRAVQRGGGGGRWPQAVGPSLGGGELASSGPFGPTLLLLQVPLQPGEGLPYRGDDYEDEYDDTYDGNQVGANDADSDDELISRR